MSNPPTFEEAVRRLEEIVEHLEGGDVPLDQTLNLFREGIDLRKRCDELLKSAQTQLKLLMEGANNTTLEIDEHAVQGDGVSRGVESLAVPSGPVPDPDDLPFE